MTLARAWATGDKTAPEPLLSASDVRALLLEHAGRGRSLETLLAMAEAGTIPAYRDESRKTKYGSHPIVFRWSEVAPILLGQARGQGASSKIVRIVPAKKGR